MEAEAWELDFADTAVGDVRDPYPTYAAGRAHGVSPEQSHYGARVLMAFRYDDVHQILRDAATFSSTVYEENMGVVMGPSILQMDGTHHVVHRTLVASAFRRKALEAWEHTLIEPTVNGLIDRFARRGRAELVGELTFRYPVRIISKILGIPDEDTARFARLSIELISLAVNFDRGVAASKELRDYFAGVVADRRRDPRDDVISALATAEVDGERLPDEEIYGFLRLLLPAGAETTYRLLGTVLFALLSDPALLEEVRADRSLIEPAIEEALRWEAPVQFIARRTTCETNVGGERLLEAATVMAVLGSANRDETKFDDPDMFDVKRKGPPHLAFAEGPHRCLGEHLARMETTVAVNAVLDRLPNLRLEPGDSDPHIHGYAFRSPTSLPVRFDVR